MKKEYWCFANGELSDIRQQCTFEQLSLAVIECEKLFEETGLLFRQSLSPDVSRLCRSEEYLEYAYYHTTDSYLPFGAHNYNQWLNPTDETAAIKAYRQAKKILAPLGIELIDSYEIERREQNKMTKELKIFNSPELGQIRTVEVNGKQMFVANDVAKALGYAVPKDAIYAHCKGSGKTPPPYKWWQTGNVSYPRR